jgi:hypothetical protein
MGLGWEHYIFLGSVIDREGVRSLLDLAAERFARGDKGNTNAASTPLVSDCAEATSLGAQMKPPAMAARLPDEQAIHVLSLLFRDAGEDGGEEDCNPSYFSLFEGGSITFALRGAMCRLPERPLHRPTPACPVRVVGAEAEALRARFATHCRVGVADLERAAGHPSALGSASVGWGWWMAEIFWCSIDDSPNELVWAVPVELDSSVGVGVDVGVGVGS